MGRCPTGSLPGRLFRGGRKKGLSAALEAEVLQEVEALVGPGAVEELDFEALEVALRHGTLRLAARAIEQRLNADTSDYTGAQRPCSCGQTARYVDRRSTSKSKNTSATWPRPSMDRRAKPRHDRPQRRSQLLLQPTNFDTTIYSEKLLKCGCPLAAQAGLRIMQCAMEEEVRSWRGGDQVARWTATALLLAEKKFRKVKGYRSMPFLLRALETEAPTQMVA